MVKNISFDDYVSQQLKNHEFMAGFNAESAKLEIAVVVMKERERAGLTQRELAERAGVLQSTIARIEHGHNTSFDTMGKIAFAFGKKLKVEFM